MNININIKKIITESPNILIVLNSGVCTQHVGQHTPETIFQFGKLAWVQVEGCNDPLTGHPIYVSIEKSKVDKSGVKVLDWAIIDITDNDTIAFTSCLGDSPPA